VQPGQQLTNRERLVGELNDLYATSVSLAVTGALPWPWLSGSAVEDKRDKIEKFMHYSRSLGILEEDHK
jgi:hypothetical protein